MGLNFLEKEMLDSFIKKLEGDTSLPTDLITSIRNLHLANKLATGDALKNAIEEHSSIGGTANEDKST